MFLITEIIIHKNFCEVLVNPQYDTSVEKYKINYCITKFTVV